MFQKLLLTLTLIFGAIPAFGQSCDFLTASIAVPSVPACQEGYTRNSARATLCFVTYKAHVRHAQKTLCSALRESNRVFSDSTFALEDEIDDLIEAAYAEQDASYRRAWHQYEAGLITIHEVFEAWDHADDVLDHALDGIFQYELQQIAEIQATWQATQDAAYAALPPKIAAAKDDYATCMAAACEPDEEDQFVGSSGTLPPFAAIAF